MTEDNKCGSLWWWVRPQIPPKPPKKEGYILVLNLDNEWEYVPITGDDDTQ